MDLGWHKAKIVSRDDLILREFPRLLKNRRMAIMRGKIICGGSTSIGRHPCLAPDVGEGVGSVGPVGRGANGCKTAPAWGPVGRSL